MLLDFWIRESCLWPLFLKQTIGLTDFEESTVGKVVEVAIFTINQKKID